jgi:hypothetical protein
MASIRTYRCTHTLCRFELYLTRNMPVWHPETPVRLQKLPVPAEAQQYVTGYRSDSFCRYCRKAVPMRDDRVCSQCERGGIYEEEGGRSCPTCLVGRLMLVHQSVH